MSNFQSLFPLLTVKAAQDAQKKTGCLASVTLAQWAQESGFGKYQLNANNPFGMKWYKGCPFASVTVMTKEYVNGHYVNVAAKFIAFPDIETAFEEHGKLLMNPKGPYKSALAVKDDWRKFVDAVASIYATDPNYKKALTSLITMYKLDRYDKVAVPK